MIKTIRHTVLGVRNFLRRWRDMARLVEDNNYNQYYKF